MPKKIFITGASGLLGLNLVLQLGEHHDVFVLENTRKVDLPVVSAIRMDLSSCADIEKGLRLFRPDVVIHAAGMTNVDECDERPLEANFVNGVLAGNLAKVCYDLGAKFVHISTDHLFDGTKALITEDVAPCPINAYGSSKALGEELVASNNPDSLIVRCNFFGWGPSYKPSLSDFIFRNLCEKKRVRLVEDVFYTPASTASLINSIQNLIGLDANGIFNAVGSQRVSKYEFGLQLAKSFSLQTDLIEKVKWRSLGARANRPMDMSLSDGKIRECIGRDLGAVVQNIENLQSQVGTSLFERITAL